MDEEEEVVLPASPPPLPPLPTTGGDVGDVELEPDAGDTAARLEAALAELTSVKMEVVRLTQQLQQRDRERSRLNRELDSTKNQLRSATQELEKTQAAHKVVVQQLMEEIRAITSAETPEGQWQTPRSSNRQSQNSRDGGAGGGGNSKGKQPVRVLLNPDRSKKQAPPTNKPKGDRRGNANNRSTPNHGGGGGRSSTPAVPAPAPNAAPAPTQSAAGGTDVAELRAGITMKLRNAAMAQDRAALVAAIAEAESAGLSHEASIGRRQLSKLG